jgi:hypothetical protein
MGGKVRMGGNRRHGLAGTKKVVEYFIKTIDIHDHDCTLCSESVTPNQAKRMVIKPPANVVYIERQVGWWSEKDGLVYDETETLYTNEELEKEI